MDPVSTLLAIEEIKRLKAKYFRFVDTKNWPEFRTLFTDDAVLEFQESMAEPASIDQFMDMLPSFLDGAVSVHHGYMPEVTIETADAASAIWAMDDCLIFPDRDDTPGGMAMLRGYGHYHETYVRRGGEWSIHTLRLTRIRLERTLRAQVIA